MDKRPRQGDTQHRTEPEIIPPGQPDRRSRRLEAQVWISIGSHVRQLHLAKPGLFSIIMALLLVGIVTTIMLAILLGVLLIWIPFLGVLIGAFILWRVVRGPYDVV